MLSDRPVTMPIRRVSTAESRVLLARFSERQPMTSEQLRAYTIELRVVLWTRRLDLHAVAHLIDLMCQLHHEGLAHTPRLEAAFARYFDDLYFGILYRQAQDDNGIEQARLTYLLEHEVACGRLRTNRLANLLTSNQPGTWWSRWISAIVRTVFIAQLQWHEFRATASFVRLSNLNNTSQ